MTIQPPIGSDDFIIYQQVEAEATLAPEEWQNKYDELMDKLDELIKETSSHAQGSNAFEALHNKVTDLKKQLENLKPGDDLTDIETQIVQETKSIDLTDVIKTGGLGGGPFAIEAARKELRDRTGKTTQGYENILKQFSDNKDNLSVKDNVEILALMRAVEAKMARTPMSIATLNFIDEDLEEIQAILNAAKDSPVTLTQEQKDLIAAYENLLQEMPNYKESMSPDKYNAINSHMRNIKKILRESTIDTDVVAATKADFQAINEIVHPKTYDEVLTAYNDLMKEIADVDIGTSDKERISAIMQSVKNILDQPNPDSDALALAYKGETNSLLAAKNALEDAKMRAPVAKDYDLLISQLAEYKSDISLEEYASILDETKKIKVILDQPNPTSAMLASAQSQIQTANYHLAVAIYNAM